MCKAFFAEDIHVGKHYTIQKEPYKKLHQRKLGRNNPLF